MKSGHATSTEPNSQLLRSIKHNVFIYNYKLFFINTPSYKKGINKIFIVTLKTTATQKTVVQQQRKKNLYPS